MSEIKIRDVIKEMNMSKPVTVSPETQLNRALDIMSNKNYSQLPVVEEGKFRGMLSYKSIAKQVELSQDLIGRNTKDRPITLLDLPVRHFTDPDAEFLSLNDSIFKLFKATKAEDAVLIGEDESAPQYIITNSDVVDILEKLSNAFLLIEQIEDSLRFIIKKQMTMQGLDCSEIVQKINQHVPPEHALPETIEKMSWENYIDFITRKECWSPLFSGIFNNITLVRKYFSFVRDLRNDVFHFRRLSHTLSDSEINKLKRIKAWLKNFE